MLIKLYCKVEWVTSFVSLAIILKYTFEDDSKGITVDVMLVNLNEI